MRNGFELLKVMRKKVDSSRKSPIWDWRVEVKHLRCGTIFERQWAYFKGIGNFRCPECKPYTTAKITIEKLKENIGRKSGHRLISIADSKGNETEIVKGKNTFIRIYCQKADQEVDTTYGSYMISKGCSACYDLKRKKRGENEGRIRKAKNIEWIRERGFEIESEHKYINVTTRLRLRHLKCNHTFHKKFKSFQNKPECPQCNPRAGIGLKRELEEVIRIVESKSGHSFISVDEYSKIGRKSTIRLWCEQLNREVETTIQNYQSAEGCCWDCADLSRQKKRLIQLEKEMADEGCTLLTEEYTGVEQLLEAICYRGHLFKIRVHSWVLGHRCRYCQYEDQSGEGSPVYRGGVRESGLTSVHYISKLGNLETTRVDPDNEYLMQARCNNTDCRDWFNPTLSAVSARLWAASSSDASECRLYCSQECKNACELYRRTVFTCALCGETYIGRSVQRYCERCSPFRQSFSSTTKNTIKSRDLNLGWIKDDSKFEIHHILDVAEFPEYADEEWNGWALDMKSELHSIIHNVCGLAKRDIACVDERYFELAINKLKITPHRE
jgi:hypothetical protein